LLNTGGARATRVSFSGVAPGEGGTERPLSEDKLKRLRGWLCLRRQGWWRNIVPPGALSCLVQWEHSDDGTTLLCNLHSITTNQAAITVLFRVINRYVGNLPPMRGVLPGDQAPMIRNTGTGHRTAGLSSQHCGGL